MRYLKFTLKIFVLCLLFYSCRHENILEKQTTTGISFIIKGSDHNNKPEDSLSSKNVPIKQEIPLGDGNVLEASIEKDYNSIDSRAEPLPSRSKYRIMVYLDDELQQICDGTYIKGKPTQPIGDLVIGKTYTFVIYTDGYTTPPRYEKEKSYNTLTIKDVMGLFAITVKKIKITEETKLTSITLDPRSIRLRISLSSNRDNITRVQAALKDVYGSGNYRVSDGRMFPIGDTSTPVYLSFSNLNQKVVTSDYRFIFTDVVKRFLTVAFERVYVGNTVYGNIKFTLNKEQYLVPGCSYKINFRIVR